MALFDRLKGLRTARAVWLSLAVISFGSASLMAGCANRSDKVGAVGASQGTAQAGGADGSKNANPNEAAKTGANNHVTTSSSGDLPQIEAARKQIRLDKMPDSTIICTVVGYPITVGEYRRQFKARQKRFQDQVALNPDVAQSYMEDAKRRDITLTEDEKKRLVETAKVAQGSATNFKQYLEQAHLTEEQFNNKILDLGVAYKASTRTIEEKLLRDLVDRELICAEARVNGLTKTAFNKYVEFKQTPNYEESLKESNSTSEQFREDIVKNFLVALMLDKIKKEAPVSDAELQKYYDANKEKFKHGDRIRISQIVIAAPKESIGPVESVEKQLRRANPKMSADELNANILRTEQAQKHKAEDILKRVINGEDFATLANQYTDDIPVRAMKRGGDMGFQPKERLSKMFIEKLWPLKPGQVCQEVLESPFGYHIFKVTAKEGPGHYSLSEIKPELRALLGEISTSDAVSNWLKEKHKTAKIALSPEFQALVSADVKTNVH